MNDDLLSSPQFIFFIGEYHMQGWKIYTFCLEKAYHYQRMFIAEKENTEFVFLVFKETKLPNARS